MDHIYLYICSEDDYFTYFTHQVIDGSKVVAQTLSTKCKATGKRTFGERSGDISLIPGSALTDEEYFKET